jgi:arylsulfatase A-like enzyme
MRFHVVALAMSPILTLFPTPVIAAEMPNIVFVLADDLGYGDLGCYGQTKIRTPVLDRLAKEGMRLTRHYCGNAVCAPSRCVLMTGLHPGHAFIRDNKEMKPEGQYPLPAGTVTLARLLKEHGYVTGAFGKWGLGGPRTTGDPLTQGFDRFFGFNCQAVAHNSYPTYLWDNDKRLALNNPPFPANDKLKPNEDSSKPETYARFVGTDYAPDRFAEQALAFVSANQGKPFFLYWPTTVPHLALQVPNDSLKDYAGQWDDPPYLGGKGYLPHYQPRAAYAAMITRMDRAIGRLMDRIKELGLDEKTLFVFSSDNGPLYDKYGGTDCEFFNSNGGLRGRKGSLYEGGVREPCIVRWPGVVPAGKASDRVSGFEDWLPTILELTGIHDVPMGLDGISLVPTLRGGQQPERPFLYREFPGYGGQQSVRVGNWKAVRQKLNPLPATGTPKTELYDLAGDLTESHDVADKHPDVLAKLETLMREQHTASKVFPIPALDR